MATFYRFFDYDHPSSNGGISEPEQREIRTLIKNCQKVMIRTKAFARHCVFFARIIYQQFQSRGAEIKTCHWPQQMYQEGTHQVVMYRGYCLEPNPIYIAEQRGYYWEPQTLTGQSDLLAECWDRPWCSVYSRRFFIIIKESIICGTNIRDSQIEFCDNWVLNQFRIGHAAAQSNAEANHQIVQAARMFWSAKTHIARTQRLRFFIVQ